MHRQSLPWIICLLLSTVLLAQNSAELTSWWSSSASAAEANVVDEASFGSLAQDAQDPQAVYEAADLIKKRADSERSYMPFVNISTMDLGIYSLPKGGTDGQEPHALDEIYYVLSGKASINIEGTSHAVKEGSIIFVAAGDKHKFEEIEEDLDLLVFFSKAPPQKDN